jgi:hypothetical protein
MIDWLNASEDDAARRRIRRLLRNVQIVRSNWVAVEDGEGGALEYRGPVKEYRRAHKEIIRLMRTYKFSPLVASFGGRIIKQWTQAMDTYFGS